MNTFKVTFTDGTHYVTSANGTREEFESYLMQEGGVVVDENPATGEETRRQIARVEEVCEKLNAYKIKGTSRQIGAIGIFEPFERIITAESPREAYNLNREHLEKTREYVLTMEIQESKIATVCGLGAIGTQFATVDPDRYLY